MNSPNTKLGEILLAERLISQAELNNAMEKQKSSREYKPIGQILVEQNAITQRQLQYVLDQFNKRTNLGDILKKSGLVTDQDIKAALKIQEDTGRRIGECLMDLKLLTERDLRGALCAQLNIPFVNVDKLDLDKALSKLLNKRYCEHHRIVPIEKMGATLTVAMDDPTDTNAIQELGAFTGLQINVVTSTHDAIQRGLSRVHGEVAEDESEATKIFRVSGDNADTEDQDEPLSAEELKHADAIVSEIIKIGMKNKASDIHIETQERRIAVRYRVDGLLTELPLGHIEGRMEAMRRKISSRIKIMANLDITEKRRPQDGSFTAVINAAGTRSRVDFRISVLPSYFGENIVLRILDSRLAPQSIDDLGYSPKIGYQLRSLLRRTTGVLLVVGPTGSGKSTSLYGALMSIFRPGINILTAEDPIEYLYEGITQCQVNPAIGNTFASYIRSFLRQDPEVILVGEIRDSETAEVTFQAAQTGHLVLSTLHTNDAVGTIPRLLELGVAPGIIASSLIGVLSQRLVRRVCPRCKTLMQPDAELLDELFGSAPRTIQWVAGSKCEYCHHTGYKGRFAVAELWSCDEHELFKAVSHADIEDLHEMMRRNERSVLMAEDAMIKLRAQETTLEELSRTLPFSALYNLRQYA